MTESQKPESDNAIFAVTLNAGVVLWLAAAVAWIVWQFAGEGELGLGAVAIPFWAWTVTVLPAAMVLALLAFLWSLRRPEYRRTVLSAAALFILPLILAQIVFSAVATLFPAPSGQGGGGMMFRASAGPVMFVLYLAGALLAWKRRRAAIERVVGGFLLPPALGIAVAAAGLVIETVNSSYWQARGELTLASKNVEWRLPEGLNVEVTLDVQRKGPATLYAFYKVGNASSPVATITIDGEPVAGREPALVTLQPGQPLQIGLHWPSLSTTSRQDSRRVVLRVVQGQDYHGGGLLAAFEIDADPPPERLAALDAPPSPEKIDGLYGYVNAAGREVIAPSFQWADNFHNGIAMVRTAGGEGFIDTDGEFVIPPRYARARRFSQGVAPVAIEDPSRRHRFGYIDRDGNTVIEFRFDNAYPFFEGRARVVVDGRTGYIDKSGDFAVQPMWDAGRDFHGGMAPVRHGRLWGFVAPDGELIVEPIFEALQPYQRGRWNVMRDGRWGPVSAEGQWRPEKDG